MTSQSAVYHGSQFEVRVERRVLVEGVGAQVEVNFIESQRVFGKILII